MRQSGYYEIGEKRAQRVSDLFSSIATRYDLINDMQSGFMHRYWKSRVIWALKPSEGESALDICCGTGDISELLWNRGAQVTGLDFNSEMLAIARIRAGELARSGMGPGGVKPDYILGDALNLPFQDKAFDLISMSYGLRNLADFRKGLEEMARVARPGCRIAILDFGKPTNPTLREMYFNYLRLSVPVLGQIMAGDRSAYAYILESLHKYPDPDFFISILGSLGIQARAESFMGGVMTLIHGQKN